MEVDSGPARIGSPQLSFLSRFVARLRTCSAMIKDLPSSRRAVNVIDCLVSSARSRNQLPRFVAI